MAEKQQINWVDMVVPNPKSVADFYSAVVGYTLDPCDEGDGRTSYSLIDGNSKEAFGICDKGAFPNWTGGWVLYIEVEDLQKRVARIEEHGGEEAHDEHARARIGAAGRVRDRQGHVPGADQAHRRGHRAAAPRRDGARRRPGVAVDRTATRR